MIARTAARGSNRDRAIAAYSALTVRRHVRLFKSAIAANEPVAMTTPGPKQALFAQFAAIAKTLGHGHRLELLEQLAQGERTVDVLAQRTGLSVANASQHLQHLRRAGLLKSRRQGKFVYYTLADDGILEVLSALRRIAERNVAEVERVVRSYFNKLD